MADNIGSRSSVVLGVTVAMIVCSAVFVFFRLVSRIGIVRRVSWDDYIMILAWVIAFGLSFAICYGTSYGLGRHEVDVPRDWQSRLKRSQYIFSVLYNPALMATKTSILVFYLTLSKTNKVFRWACIATLVVVNAAGVALTFLNIFQCRPIGAVFDTPVSTTASCTDIVTIYLSSAPVNIITDLAILFLPMPILTGMRLPRKQKTILVITFGFGVFVAVVDVVRIAYLQQASMTRLQEIQNDSSTATQSRNSEASDFSWYASLSFMWSAIEVNVGIMCACVPALKPLVSRFMPHLLRDSVDATEKSMSLDNSQTLEMAAAQRIPSIPDPPKRPTRYIGHDDDGPMGIMDFLTTPETTELPMQPLGRSQTAMTDTTRHTRAGTPTFFDFVNMKRKKSMVQMTNNESYFPLAMVTILFFLWGFAYGLLDVLNSQFQVIARMSTGQSVAIHSAYFGGYIVAPLTFGRLALKNWGFKACYIIGLCIYACGTLIFWPSAVLTSFPAFLVSNFIVGAGLSTLEIAANPFIALCGPAEYSEIRLNLSQGVQAIGSIVSPLLARKVLFRNVLDAPSLINVQWTYLGIALFTVLLAVGYYYVPLPEATDEELEDASERANHANKAEVGGIRVLWITLGFGVFAQFVYCGGQEVVSTSFSNYLTSAGSALDPTNHMAITHTAFAVGRFAAAGLGFFIKPRRLLLFFQIGAIVFAALTMNFHGDTAASFLVVLLLFEGPIFSLIFAQTLRGLGKHTKDGSALLTAAISGGAVFPPIASSVAANRGGQGTQYSFCVALAVFAAGILLPLYLNIVPAAKLQVDPVKVVNDSRCASPTSVGKARRFSLFSMKKKTSKEMPVAEHRERGSDSSDWPRG